MIGVVDGDIVERRVWKMRVVAEDGMGGKVKNGGMDYQGGWLIKGTRNLEPWWKQKGSREQKGTIRRPSENP